MMKFQVRVLCFSYNHVSYIEETLDGFCNQKTTFPFVCIIFDDKSTDGESDKLKLYLNKNFQVNDNKTSYYIDCNNYYLKFAQHKTNKNCFFAVFFLKYNHYSIKKKKSLYLDDFIDFDTKYIAICEGDDYWTDPLKLQKQFDFMESHPDYSLYFHNASYFNQNLKKITGEFNSFTEDTTVPSETIILKGGGFCPTCSLFYRMSIMKGYPNFARYYHIGDYPLQLYLAIKGKVFYSHENMATYRIMVPGSWTVKTYGNIQLGERKYALKKYKDLLKSFEFINKFDEFSNYKFHETFEKVKNGYSCDVILYNGIRKKLHLIKNTRSKKEKLLFYIIKFRLFPLKRFYNKIFKH